MIHALALLSTALLFGGMTLYAFGFAAFLFTALPPATAAVTLRRAFPWFYAFVIATSAAAALLWWPRDAVFAAVSHLPHLIAFALINSISGQAQGKDYLSLAGPGFRDFTRIAASDPHVWRDILLSNREELIAQSRHFLRALHGLEAAIKSGDTDALEALIDQASAARANWRMTAIKPQG